MYQKLISKNCYSAKVQGDKREDQEDCLTLRDQRFKSIVNWEIKIQGRREKSEEINQK